MHQRKNIYSFSGAILSLLHCEFCGASLVGGKVPSNHLRPQKKMLLNGLGG